MRKYFAPALMVLITFVLDTSILPRVYQGVYSVPLMLVAVLLIGMIAGRTQGLVFGTLGGLLLDITTGTLGMMTFYFMGVGFMIGFILNSMVDVAQLRTASNVRREWIQRVVWIFVLVLLGEIVLFVLQYFYTAHFEWVYIRNLLARTVIATALTLLLRPLAIRWIRGGARLGAPGRRASASDAKQSSDTRKREVKSF